jgi:large subunit ribosomal protein L9
MEVILLEDVKGVGKKGETKTVADGYAINFLIAKNYAVRKTNEALNTLKREQAKEDAHQAELKALALENKEKLEKITLEFKAKGAKNHIMIGEISTKEVVKVLSEQYKINIDKRKFVDKIKINAFGVTVLENELYKGVVAKIKIHVVEEN